MLQKPYQLLGAHDTQGGSAVMAAGNGNGRQSHDQNATPNRWRALEAAALKAATQGGDIGIVDALCRELEEVTPRGNGVAKNARGRITRLKKRVPASDVERRLEACRIQLGGRPDEVASHVSVDCTRKLVSPARRAGRSRLQPPIVP
jgi:hypothetical protein